MEWDAREGSLRDRIKDYREGVLDNGQAGGLGVVGTMEVN